MDSSLCFMNKLTPGGYHCVKKLETPSHQAHQIVELIDHMILVIVILILQKDIITPGSQGGVAALWLNPAHHGIPRCNCPGGPGIQ